LKNAVQQAEEHVRQQSNNPPNELIDLLKRTYQIEEIDFDMKRKLAESAFLTAKDHVIFEKRNFEEVFLFILG